MEFIDAMAVERGTTLILLKSYDGKVPVGTKWAVIQPVDVGDIAFITASALPGQDGVGTNINETLPSDHWALDGSAEAVEALTGNLTTNGGNGMATAKAAVVRPAPDVPLTPVVCTAPEPTLEPTMDLTEPALWDVEDGEVADRFREYAPDSEISRRFFMAYLRVHPPFEETQLLQIMDIAEIPQDIEWTEATVANMYFLFSRVNGIEIDPIIFRVSPMLRQAVEAVEGGEERPKKRGRRSKAEIEAERAAQGAADSPKIVSLVPPGVCDVERKFQGLPPHGQTPSMGVTPEEAAALTGPVNTGSYAYSTRHLQTHHELAGIILKFLAEKQFDANQAAESLELARNIVRSALQM